MESNIHTAMLEVYGKVGYVQKTGKVAFGSTKYSYAGEADLIEALRPAMIAAGIVFHPYSVKDASYQVVSAGKDKYDQPKYVYAAVATYGFRFVHAASGTHIDVEVRGEGNDSLDKASYKAATGALKYALRQAFLIETGDDPDETAAKQKPEPTEDEKRTMAQQWGEKYLRAVRDAKTPDELLKAIAKGEKNLPAVQKTDPELHKGILKEIAEQKERLRVTN